MKILNRVRVFSAKFFPMTNHRRPKIRLTDLWNNKSVFIPIEVGESIDDRMEEFFRMRDIPVQGDSTNKKTGEVLYYTDNFEIQL